MVYVDPLFYWPGKRKPWSHMWADSTPELHNMAERIGVKKCWFENKRGKNFPHYDLHEDKRLLAISNGAKEKNLGIISWKEKIPYFFESSHVFEYSWFRKA